MTFTFTLDCFPDYTKFNKTEKVFADIQVITEDVETLEEKREPCKLFEAKGMGGATMNYNNEGTESLIKITAEGTNVMGRTLDESYEKAVFGDLTSKGDFAQATVFFNNLDDRKTYTVTQSNPALKVAYPDEVEFQNNIKKKDYSGAELKGGYGLLLGTIPGLVTLTILDKATNEVMQTVQITNKIAFKKSSAVTINDTGSVITEKKVNEEIVDEISRVYENDVICLTLSSNTAEVKATNGVVHKELTGNLYTITVQSGDTTTITVE